VREREKEEKRKREREREEERERKREREKERERESKREHACVSLKSGRIYLCCAEFVYETVFLAVVCVRDKE